MGQKQKTEGEKRERLNDGNNNGHGARKYAWRTQAAWAKKIKITIFFSSYFNNYFFRTKNQIGSFSEVGEKQKT